MLTPAAADVVGPSTPRRFLRISRVVELTGLRPSTLYLMMSEGRFPKSISLGPRIRAWAEDEICEWQDARIAERGQENAAARGDGV